MRLHIRETQLFIQNLHTRLPFRYGIVTMTRVPHLILRITMEVDGRIQHGFAADNLAPKWFAKNPASTVQDDISEMLTVIQHACEVAKQITSATSIFECWQQVYSAQRQWAEAEQLPPLLWGFGVSLIERGLIDASCRNRQCSFSASISQNTFALPLAFFFPELSSLVPASFIPSKPHPEVIVRHTIGLTDPLTDEEITPQDRLDDGLPESLQQCLGRYGITHLKIKLSGEADADLQRLKRIASLIKSAGTRCAFTLDGNENYRSLTPFRHLWETLLADPMLARFLENLIFVEQPLHRSVALSPATALEMIVWRERPPIIIDESDAEVGTLASALACGYSGTSHKNCKGVFKGIANACLIAYRRRLDPTAQLHISAEDLTNVGPIALLQDLAVIGTLGITHAERNGHHYFAGLSEFPEEIQKGVFLHHQDLYERHPSGFPTLRIRSGKMAIDSVNSAPFGCAFEPDTSSFIPIETWRFESLEN